MVRHEEPNVLRVEFRRGEHKMRVFAKDLTGVSVDMERFWSFTIGNVRFYHWEKVKL